MNLGKLLKDARQEKRKEAEDRKTQDLRQPLLTYIENVRQRGIPDALIQNLGQCKTVGEAKRIVREFRSTESNQVAS